MESSSLPGSTDPNSRRGLLDHLSDGELITEWSCEPDIIIKPSPEVQMKRLRVYIPERESTFVCNLHALHLELIHKILGCLDILSLLQYARTCCIAYSQVGGYRPYRRLKLYASNALNALRRTHAIKYLPVQVLYDSLRSPHCVSCHQFGAYLHLITGARCCHYCLRSNPAFWMISRQQACDIFDLTASKLVDIPQTVNRAAEGMPLRMWPPYAGRFNGILVNVRTVKELAIKIRGPIDPYAPPRKDHPATSARARRRAQELRVLLRKAPMDGVVPFDANNPRIPQGSPALDKYGSISAVKFPRLLPDNVIDRGYWCRGCWKIYSTHEFRHTRHINPQVTQILVAFEYDSDYFDLLGKQEKSRVEFVKHVRQCHAVRMVYEHEREEEKKRKRKKKEL